MTSPLPPQGGAVVMAVVTQGDLDPALIAKIAGEGETWLDYRHLRRSADGKTLTDIITGEAAFVRQRCPKTAQ